MKDYPLEIDFLYREDVEGPAILYSKGHHAIDAFKKRALQELEGYPNKIVNLQARMPEYLYAKTVGYFEGRKRVGYTLSLSKTPLKGYFPVTLIEVV